VGQRATLSAIGNRAKLTFLKPSAGASATRAQRATLPHKAAVHRYNQF
jgi:hypothetical protein